MKKQFINDVLTEMMDYLNNDELKKLQESLTLVTGRYNFSMKGAANQDDTNYVETFLAAKRIEGCSERTIQYYGTTIYKMLKSIDTPIRKITTERIRQSLRFLGASSKRFMILPRI